MKASDLFNKSDMRASKVLSGKDCLCNIHKKVNGDMVERIANNAGKDITYLDKKVGGRLHKI